MGDFLSFQRMMAPAIVEIIWWFSVAVAVVHGATLALNDQLVEALLVIVLGPLITRVLAKLSIVAFRIYGALEEIAENTQVAPAHNE